MSLRFLFLFFFFLLEQLAEENWYNLKVGRQQDKQICWWPRKWWRKGKSMIQFLMLVLTCLLDIQVKMCRMTLEKWIWTLGEIFGLTQIWVIFKALRLGKMTKGGKIERKKYIEILPLGPLGLMGWYQHNFHILDLFSEVFFNFL